MNLLLQFLGSNVLGSGYADLPVPARWDLSIPVGSAAGQANKVAQLTRYEIAGGATFAFDLDSINLPDQTVAPDAISGILIRAYSTNQDTVSVQTGATNGFSNLVGTALDSPIEAGGFWGMSNPAGVAPTPTNKQLQIVNDDATNAAHVDIIYWGRKA